MTTMQQFNKKKIILISIAFLGLTMLYIVGYSKMMFTSEIIMQNQTKELVLTGELSSERVVQQNIKIPENYNHQYIDFNIYFATYQRSNSSSLEITLIQNENRDAVNVNAGELKDNSYYKVRFKNKEFKAGDAVLEVKSNNAASGNAITMALTKDVSQGTAIVDGTEQQQYGLLHQEFFSVKDWSKLFLVLFSIIFLFLYLMIMRIFESKLNYNFLLSIIIIVTIIIYRFPSLTVSNEIWAEGATNFYFNASEQGWFANLKQLDAGYLPLLTRIISLVLVKILHVDVIFPMMSQFVAIIIIATFASIINLNYLNKLIPSKLLRFIIGLVLGLGLFYDYELFTFINFAYMGIIPGLLIIFVDFENLKKWKLVALSIIFFMILSSKAFFIIFLPLYALFLAYHLYKKNYKSVSFYSVTAASMILQFFIMIFNRSTWTEQPGEANVSLSLVDLIIQAISLYIKNAYLLFFKLSSSQTDTSIQLVSIMVLIILTLVSFYISRKHLSITVYAFIIATQVLAFISIAMSLTVPYIKNLEVWDTQFSVPFTRHFIFSNILIFLGVIVWLTNLLKQKKQQFIAGMLIITMYCLVGFNAGEIYKYENYSFSNWQETYNAYENGACISVNPYPWVVCKPGTQAYPTMAVTTTSGIQQIDLKLVLEGADKWVVNGLILDKGNAWNRKIKIIAYDEKNQAVNEAVESNDYTRRYGYFKFNSSTQVNYIKFFDENNNAILLDNPQLIMFGPS